MLSSLNNIPSALPALTPRSSFVSGSRIFSEVPRVENLKKEAREEALRFGKPGAFDSKYIGSFRKSEVAHLRTDSLAKPLLRLAVVFVNKEMSDRRTVGPYVSPVPA